MILLGFMNRSETDFPEPSLVLLPILVLVKFMCNSERPFFFLVGCGCIPAGVQLSCFGVEDSSMWNSCGAKIFFYRLGWLNLNLLQCWYVHGACRFFNAHDSHSTCVLWVSTDWPNFGSRFLDSKKEMIVVGFGRFRRFAWDHTGQINSK